MTVFWIVIGVTIVALLVMFAKSAAREANRITIESDFRIDGLSANIDSVSHLLHDNDNAAEKAERKAARYKARAEEVASRQAPEWKVFSRAVRKTKR